MKQAVLRKNITLKELKFVDIINTNEVLVFTYKKQDFVAHLSIDGYIVEEHDTVHARAKHVCANGDAHYDKPSNWTNDCVTRYRREHNETGECKTNPSGYERIIVPRYAKSLNELRADYAKTYHINPLDLPKTPREILQMNVEKYEGVATQKEEHTGDACMYDDDNNNEPGNVNMLECSIATLKANAGIRGYKNIAQELEHANFRLKREMDRFKQHVSALVEHVSDQLPVAIDARKTLEKHASYYSRAHRLETAPSAPARKRARVEPVVSRASLVSQATTTQINVHALLEHSVLTRIPRNVTV